MEWSKRIVVPLLLAVALVPAACGDDGSPGARLSAEEFVEQANAACVEGDEELEAVGEELFAGGRPDVSAISEFFLEEAIPIARSKLDRIEDLDPPADEEEAVEELVAAGHTAVDEVEEGLREDPGGYLQRAGPDPFASFNQMARDLGLDRCAGVVDDLPEEGATTTSTTASTTETTPTTPTGEGGS